MHTQKGTKLTIGTDTEFALYHRHSHQYIPATAYNTPGEKGNAVPVVAGRHVIGSYHRDNISVEIQSLICHSAAELSSNVRELRAEIQSVYTKSIDAALIAIPGARYKKEMLQLPEALEMGCEPDVDAYTGEVIPGPKARDMGSLRTFGAHLHIGGLDDTDNEFRMEVVKLLDASIGACLARYEDAMGNSNGRARRRFYGRAGRMRFKPYGLEYRTPSPIWVRTLDEKGGGLHTCICDWVTMAVSSVELGKTTAYFKIDESIVQDAINGREEVRPAELLYRARHHPGIVEYLKQEQAA